MQPNPEVNKLRGMGPVVTGSSHHTGKQENKLPTHAGFLFSVHEWRKIGWEEFNARLRIFNKKSPGLDSKVKVSVGIMTRELNA